MRMMNYIKNGIRIVFILLFAQVHAQKILSKEEALQIALENNYGVKIAQNNVEIAKNNKSIFNSGFLPTLIAQGGANYDNSDIESELQDGTITSSIGAETKSYNASLNLNVTLFDGLGRKYDLKKFKETYQLSELEAKEVIEDMYLRLYTVYFQIARFSENTKVLKETMEISKLRLKRIQYQNDYGQSTKLELLRAEVDVNNDSINFIDSRQQLMNIKRDLNIILGTQLEYEYDVETSVDFIKLLSFEELLEMAENNNVVLQQQEKNINISKFNIKASKSSYFPSIGLNSSYGWYLNDNPSTSAIVSNEINGFSAGLNVAWNLFDGGSTKTRVANAKIALENQEILKQQQEETIENILKNTYEEYVNKLFVLRAQEKNVVTNQATFERSFEQYKIGQISSIEFRQAQINLLSSQTGLNNAKYDAKLIELLLLQLSGQILDLSY
jgi:outer membrane protein TolC